MKIEHFALSDVGRVRGRNEDSNLVLPEVHLFAVADGMGGHVGGKQASEITVETLRERLSDGASPGVRRLHDAIVEANRRIVSRAGDDPTLHGMGSTLVALWLPAGGRAVIAHVGDSRAYRLRDGQLEQLTSDHSIVGEMVRRQDISESDAVRHPYRHVLTRALGNADGVQPDVAEIDVVPGDLYVLCSDGVYGMLEREAFERIVREHVEAPEDLARALVDSANEGGGKDNATVVIVRCLE